MSTTTISLPRPFILTKAWLASVLMGRLLSSPYMCKRASGATTAFGGRRAGLLRAGGAGLLHHLAPAHDLGPDVALQRFGRRAHDRNETAVGKILLDIGLGHDGPQLPIELMQDRLGEPRRRGHHLPR